MNSKGAVPPLVLLAVAGVLILLVVTTLGGFKDELFSFLYPKPTSNASTSGLLHSSSFESGDFIDWDQINASEGTLKVVDGGSTIAGNSDGVKIAEATQNGSGNSAGHFSRTIWNLNNWSSETSYQTSANFYLPAGFYNNMMGAVQIIGWDTFPDLNNHMRLIIYNSDKKARLFINDNGDKRDITGAFSIPEGMWSTIKIEQKISQTDGWSKVYLNNNLVASGDKTNCPANAVSCFDTQSAFPVTRIRYGFVAVDDPKQLKPLTLFFDKIELGLLSENSPAPSSLPSSSPPMSPSPQASVSTADTINPVVTITSPLNGATISRKSRITITASASDNITVSKVEFYINGSLKFTDTAAAFSYNWSVPASKGNNIILVKAFDAAGNYSTASASVTVK